jgi:hypothetical protein
MCSASDSDSSLELGGNDDTEAFIDGLINEGAKAHKVAEVELDKVLGSAGQVSGSKNKKQPSVASLISQKYQRGKKLDVDSKRSHGGDAKAANKARKPVMQPTFSSLNDAHVLIERIPEETKASILAHPPESHAMYVNNYLNMQLKRLSVLQQETVKSQQSELAKLEKLEEILQSCCTELEPWTIH